MMINTKRKIIYWSLAILAIIFIVFNINSLLIYTHKITPEGGSLLDSEQIEKDLAYIFRDKYTLNSVRMLNLTHSINTSLDKEKELLEKNYEFTNDQLIQISLEDKNSRWKAITSQKANEIATNQAVQFLLYFTQRDFDTTIKVVKLFFTPKYLEIGPTDTRVIIVIDEFKMEYERLLKEGIEQEELERKLEEKFSYENILR
jgi:hypothetical protein